MLTQTDRDELQRKYPWRDGPWMTPTTGYHFIVVKVSDYEDHDRTFTKENSCYMSYTGFHAGVCIDYRTEKNAQAAADRCNERWHGRWSSDIDFAVRRVP